MIYGIGTDIVLIDRIQILLKRWPQALPRRLLHTDEWPAFQQHADPARLLAKRFAAKEAISKALGTGVRRPVLLTNIAILHDDLGKPWVKTSPDLQVWLAARSLKLHVSISDERTTVCAFAIAEYD
jgi:holo-[acyl-carrier protein] synthase